MCSDYASYYPGGRALHCDCFIRLTNITINETDFAWLLPFNSTGTLSCDEHCYFDFSACETPCGDGVVDSGEPWWEECDGSNLNGRVCADIDRYYGAEFTGG